MIIEGIQNPFVYVLENFGMPDFFLCMLFQETFWNGNKSGNKWHAIQAAKQLLLLTGYLQIK